MCGKNTTPQTLDQLLKILYNSYMLKKLFQRLGRYRVIMDRVENEPYLERYYVFLKDRDRFPFNIFVHKFLKSDTEDVHDHPWPFLTVILRGGYWEWRPQFDSQGRKSGEVARWCGPGSVRWASAHQYLSLIHI